MPESISVEASAHQSKQRSYTNTDTDVRELSERVYTIDGMVMVLEHAITLLEKLPDTVNTLRETLSAVKNQLYVIWALQLIIITAILGMALEMFKRLPAP